MEYPTLKRRVELPYVPRVYPGQNTDWIMSRDYFRHHNTWLVSQNLTDQLAQFPHATSYDIRKVQKDHAKRMRKLALENGYDAAFRFRSMSNKLLQRYDY